MSKQTNYKTLKTHCKNTSKHLQTLFKLAQERSKCPTKPRTELEMECIINRTKAIKRKQDIRSDNFIVTIDPTDYKTTVYTPPHPQEDNGRTEYKKHSLLTLLKQLMP